MNFLKIILLAFYLICLPISEISCQDISGEWKGKLSINGSKRSYTYSLNLEKKKDQWSGTSYSKDNRNKSDASFSLNGVFDGDYIIYQEDEQTSPEPAWCLKNCKLKYMRDDMWEKLEGEWSALNCKGGYINLKRRRAINPKKSKRRKAPAPKKTKSDWVGTWSGHLNQSDRDYGFYYQLSIVEDANGLWGTSYIVSEDEGGYANHLLEIELDAAGLGLTIKEPKVIYKSLPEWPWCYKSSQLLLTKDANHMFLEGDWVGHLDGGGACAPGSLYLEKPILTAEEKLAIIPKTYKGRTNTTKRLIETTFRELNLLVWDNNVVDGDRITLLLNGKEILKNKRITKYKYPLRVELTNKINYLVMYAENTGKVSPNTAAIMLDDGEKKEVVILSSDFSESGSIVIKKIE